MKKDIYIEREVNEGKREMKNDGEREGEGRKERDEEG
jgi:hypothetical protein